MNVEVLAPIGSFSMVNDILYSKCDAIYLGGIEFNMRMHSKLLNFTNEQIEMTVGLAHKLGKKVYVTVNTWFTDEELEMMSEYLIFLNEINVDAIIVQDYGVFELIKKLNLDLAVHASVMMNVHNLEQAQALETNLGISRFVLSREMSLKQVKVISDNINSEIEYFVSGDMCSVNGGICYISAIMFNKSANKGQCFKMCRWNYKLKHGGNVYQDNYYLAAKDMDMISHVDELIQSGVNSLKIEGRRKQVVDTLNLINTYADATLSYKNGTYQSDEYQGKLDYMYKRDTSTAYAFGNPGLEFINRKNEGNPLANRIFSKKGKELPITERKIDNAVNELSVNGKVQSTISLKVDNYSDAIFGLDSNVDFLYISIESFTKLMTISEIQEIINNKNKTLIYLSLPLMQSEASKKIEESYISNLSGLDGVEVSDYGQLSKYSKMMPVKTNFTFNVMNRLSAKLLLDSGADSIMPSIEATPKQLESLKTDNSLKLDLIIFGRLTTMYSDLNLYDNLKESLKVGKEDNHQFANDILVLQNQTEQENPVLLDSFNKSHILTSKVLNQLPLYDYLSGNNLIIDARGVDKCEYQLALKTLKHLISGTSVDNELTGYGSSKYFLGALNHTHKGAKYVIVK